MKKHGSPLLSALNRPMPVPKEPTPHQRMKMHAREEKIHATRKWVAGEITTKQHMGVHARANAVLKGKAGVKV
jgi:hypothetical protein